jgi:hypothetical protein
MEGNRPNYHETEDIAVMFDSGRMNDVSITQPVAEQTKTLRTVPAENVTCEALHLALNAVHIDLAWHAGAMSAEVAMEDLHRAIGKTINRCDQSARTGLR